MAMAMVMVLVLVLVLVLELMMGDDVYVLVSLNSKVIYYFMHNIYNIMNK